jgi:hypothetical protein
MLYPSFYSHSIGSTRSGLIAKWIEMFQDIVLSLLLEVPLGQMIWAGLGRNMLSVCLRHSDNQITLTFDKHLIGD